MSTYLLKPFDAEAAKRGDPVCDSTGILVKVVSEPDKANFVCAIRQGYNIVIKVEELHAAPLGWCAGRPVYPFDRLYSTFGDEVIVTKWLNILASYSWDPPKPKPVKMLCYFAGIELIWRREEAARLASWKRFPEGDFEGALE